MHPVGLLYEKTLASHIHTSLIPSVEKGIEAIILHAVLFTMTCSQNLAPSGFDALQSESIIYLLISVYSMH